MTEDGPLSPQERLEKVWNALEMPDNLRLDMAIKYSSNEYYVKMFEVGIDTSVFRHNIETCLFGFFFHKKIIYLEKQLKMLVASFVYSPCTVISDFHRGFV